MIKCKMCGGDPVETAQLFSKEIENDPDNRDAILDAAYSSLALTDVNLLGLLNEGEHKAPFFAFFGKKVVFAKKLCYNREK